jgi:VanZ family protein
MRWIIGYWKSITVLLAILVLSFMNPPSMPTVKELFSFDKVGHLMMYAGLTFMLLIETSVLKRVKSRRPYFLVLAVVLPVAVGALTELLQTLLFAPRAAEWGDFLSDVAGVVLGWLLFFAWQKWRPRFR